MNLFPYLLLMSSLLGMCTNPRGNLSAEVQASESQTLVVVVTEGMTIGDAKRIARERAAELTVQRGDRYFTIDRETQIQVLRGDSQGMPPPGNLYQELIIEGDFGKERLDREARNSPKVYPAIRLVFSSYREKPFGKGIDAWNYTSST